MPSFLTLSQMFWRITMLIDIMDETNRYTTIADDKDHLMGNGRWKPLIVVELEVFLGITLYMDLRKKPNVQSYWLKPPSIFNCSIISNLMSRRRYATLTRCLHLMDLGSYVRNQNFAWL